MIVGGLVISVYECGIVGRQGLVRRRAIQIDIRSHCNEKEKNNQSQGDEVSSDTNEEYHE